MFLEKIEIVANELGKDVYPSIKEQKIYEAKRTLTYFLQANNIPHPKTWIFYNKEQAMNFIQNATFPIVYKTHNGAGASGVEIIKSRKQAVALIKTTFDSYYINKSITDFRDIDFGYVLFQHFIEGAREHRIIKIGESWIGHEKALNQTSEFMSGSGINFWTRPTNEVLDFCRKIAEKHNFTTMCFDIFEDKQGGFYVNELQTWFGSYNPSQMYIDGIPGRFVYKDNKYLFEEGLFNHNQSLILRLVDMLNNKGIGVC
jgi:glutathione synthase/RimK-type ligase-like ATP-grasp enzyme